MDLAGFPLKPIAPNISNALSVINNFCRSESEEQSPIYWLTNKQARHMQVVSGLPLTFYNTQFSR